MNKSKIAVAITIGIMSFIIIYIMLIQISIVKENDKSEVEFLRETELKELLASYKEKYQEVNNQLTETKNKIEEYKKDEKSEEDAIKLLEDEVNQAKMCLGNTDVVGEGIVITINNNVRYDEQESSIIMASDLIKLINELRYAGAEAISINGERIISRSDIFDVGSFIYINGQRMTAPYVVKAIGDKKYLESALNIKEGYIYTYTLNNYEISMEPQDEVRINKYQGKMTLDYIKK